ncbi:hypothetical protein [Plantactinospora mayteni]|uniref:hypothetical protein n=1 Tax=Plantactinospora mayteni TaxID=566021 RepID=UPI001943AA00|nr:hypothetical protein [Plantactinospora mayteni]
MAVTTSRTIPGRRQVDQPWRPTGRAPWAGRRPGHHPELFFDVVYVLAVTQLTAAPPGGRWTEEPAP